jgi:hypothetical protein
MQTQITVKRLTGAIGAEVKGVDLSVLLTTALLPRFTRRSSITACWCSEGSFLIRRRKQSSPSLGRSAPRALSEATRDAQSSGRG